MNRWDRRKRERLVGGMNRGDGKKRGRKIDGRNEYLGEEERGEDGWEE